MSESIYDLKLHEKCEDCGTTEGVYECTCPFTEDIYDTEVMEVM